MRRTLAGLMVAVASVAVAQKKEPAPAPTFEVTGVIADAKGPLANKIVRVGPLDAQGNMLGIRNLGSASAGADGMATTDAQGRFSITVARSFFRNIPDDSLGLRVSTDVGGGRMSTAHATAVIRIDSTKAKVDAGRVMMQPLKPGSR